MEINCETHISTQQTGARTPPRLQNPHGNYEWPQNYCRSPRKGSQAPIGIGTSMCAALLSLKDSADFLRVSRSGKRCTFPSFIMQSLRQDTSSFRLGLTVSRKVGNAVVRNRAKRRLREVVRLYATPEKLAGWDIVLIARASASERAFELMRQDFVQGLKNMGVEA
jgi:ribonuclease P protein component